MLVLARFVDETIEIETDRGEKITVMFVAGRATCKGKQQVAIGVDAPRHFKIRRGEMAPLERKAAECFGL